MLVLGAVCAPPASGQGGNGLYEPFPQPRAASRAQAYAARLGVSATKVELGKGVFVGRTLRRSDGTSPPAASDRAGLSASTAGLAGLLLAVLAALGVFGVTRLRPAPSPTG